MRCELNLCILENILKLKKSKKEQQTYKVFEELLPQDLLKFGLIPEFVGRLPIVVGLDELTEDALENMENISRKRGFILPGKRIDYERCGKTLLDEFRGGVIGNITLEKA